MLRILYRHRTDTIIANFPVEQLESAVRDPQSRVWVDMEAPSDEETNLVLHKIFHFHPLAIDDAISDINIPKLDNYGHYLYLVVHTFRLGEEKMDIDTHEIDIFLGANYLITIHDTPSESYNRLWDEGYHREQGLARGPAMLLYELLDKQMDSYIPLIEEFEDRVETLGDIIFAGRQNDNALLNEILTAKTSALRLRRVIMPQREVLNDLAHAPLNVVPAEARLYFEDVHDHSVRLADLLESMRELITGTIAIHLTVVNNRLNEVMKVLTIISTIFMPLSFLASVWGMNFIYMPGLEWRWSFAVITAIFIAISAVMLYWFRQRRWI